MFDRTQILVLFVVYVMVLTIGTIVTKVISLARCGLERVTVAIRPSLEEGI